MSLDNKIAAIITAAGESQRMGGIDKMLALLDSLADKLLLQSSELVF